MNIAALSVVLSQEKVQQQAGLSVMKLTMGAAARQGESFAEMVKAIELSVQSHLGGNIDKQA